MNVGALAGTAVVPLLGIMMVLAAVITRRTVPFGVRIPYPERTVPPVILRQRQLYLWRATLICVCATVLVLALWGHGGHWLSRLVLILEIAADVACLQLGRRKIIAVNPAGRGKGWRPRQAARFIP